MITIRVSEHIDPGKTTEPASAAATSPLTRARDEHVGTYLADGNHRGLVGALVVTDAVEHGWHGATAEVADRLDTLIAEARNRVVVKRLPFDILAHLEALSDELKREIGI